VKLRDKIGWRRWSDAVELIDAAETVVDAARECQGTGGTNPEDGPFSRLRAAIAAYDRAVGK